MELLPMADQPANPGTPRWVKISGVVALVLILLVTIVILTGIGGAHGPARHLPSANNPPTPMSLQQP
jgi:hypothetical protein